MGTDEPTGAAGDAAGGGERDGTETTREHARACLLAGMDAARPETVVPETVALDGDALAVDGTTFALDEYDDVVVLGGGNAAGAAAAALEDVLGERVDGGVVVTDVPRATDRVAVVEGTHPLPSEDNRAGAERVLAAAREAGPDDLVLAPITGGGSALLCAPAAGVSVADLREVTAALLEAGAPIDELNAVRKHCSAIKGGRLARAAAPARVVGLLLSDVVGDDPGVIASGPTAPDETTYDDALAVLDRYDVTAPAAVRDHLAAGARGDRPETPTAGDAAFETTSTHVIADAETALSAAADAARERGYEPTVLSTRIRGEAAEAARTQVAVAEEVRATGRPVEPPVALLSGGETTVTVTGDGEGGPNLAFALAAAIELDDPGVAVGSVDTDGVDGVTDAAGAVVDAGTVPRADREAARDALDADDAGGFFANRREQVAVGPTGTNVNDLRVVLIDDE